MHGARILAAGIALMCAAWANAGDWYLGVGSGLLFDAERCASTPVLSRSDSEYSETKSRGRRGKLTLSEEISCQEDDELVHSLYAGVRDIINFTDNIALGAEFGYTHVGPEDLLQLSALLHISPTQNIRISPEIGITYIDGGPDEDEVGVAGLWGTYDFNTGPVPSFARVGWRRYFSVFGSDDVDTVQVGFGVRTP